METLIDWSRMQFAMTAIYHWLFVPLTIGLALIMAVMETIYVKTGKLFWRDTAKFWMKLFGINFAVGVATGLILEFEFGTNWSNYSFFVGDIFGAPLAIEGIVAFFMEATFVALMFFGWDKISKGAHLASTWLTGIGATISAWWILVANAWMQYPVGMKFNPDTVRNEMMSFIDVAFSPMAVTKFTHTVLSCWILGAVFVVGVAGWFLIKNRESKFALSSIKVAAVVGFVASILTIVTGDTSAKMVYKTQPMKLAAVEGLYDGGTDVGMVGFGIINPNKQPSDDQKSIYAELKIPYMLSWLATEDIHGFVPGINDILNGYTTPEGTTVLSAEEKMGKGRIAQQALSDYRVAKQANDKATMEQAKSILEENMPYFGYGYINDKTDLVPNVPLNFYAFRIMVILGGFFILLFIVLFLMSLRRKLEKQKWLHWIALLSIPLAYIAGQAGWIVAETGRQPWAIQDLMPVNAAVSDLAASDVKITFFIFLALFAVLLIAELRILCKAIKKGPKFSE
ncbi:MAG: cytochrome ubiquinol oxidase subunit I [Bacteroidales bacterium]|jgi:cytochrome d ubiquinol oxidase subunit I|nr:cytochrome ubiquinol oxidase subunit I [Bacteroidales bacterium]